MRSIFIGAIALVGLIRPAAAGMDHDEALEAVKSGKILPLLPIMERVENAYAGQIVAVELIKDDDGPGMFYRVKFLTTEGRLLVLSVDAATGDIVGLGGRGIGLK